MLSQRAEPARWVFFRSPGLSSSLAYCGSMLGLGEAQAGAGLPAGLMYKPYHLIMLAVAA